MSPIVRASRRPTDQIAAYLLRYLDQNAAALEPRQRERIASVLKKAERAERSTDEPRPG